MLRRQRTFFLTENQYEPVILEYVGIINGRQAYKFNKEEPDVNGYTIWARISSDAGLHWGEWYSTSVTIDFDPASFSFPFTQGSMCEVYVVVTGDGTKDPSEPSNIVTAITPEDPAYSPPVLSAFPFYENGDVYAAVKVDSFPSGVSSFVVWARELGHFNWDVCCWVNDGIVGVITQSLNIQIEAGKTYQFIAAWWDRTAGKLISDISNIAAAALPLPSINYLLPPKKLDARFYGEYQGTYLIQLAVQRGDMRATSVAVEYKRSTVGGDWQYAWDFVFSEQGVSDTTRSYFIYPSFGSSTPISGEVWQYRLKNKADGYGDSGYSDTFVVTVPSFLPKLDTPTFTLSQNGSNVIVAWNAVQNAAGYKIERRLNSASTFTVVASVPDSYSRYEDTGTARGNTYVYRITALGDNQYYQDSDSAQASITLTNIVVLPTPVIDSVTESGVDVVLIISNIDPPNTGNIDIEMSVGGGAWSHIAYSGAPSLSATSVTVTIDGTLINGGAMRFRAKALAAHAQAIDSSYSEIASLTIAEREWLLKWNGTSWDYCTDVTGGWSTQTITYSDGAEAGNVQAVDLGQGTLRLQGTGYFMTGAMTSGQTALSSKYTKICMIGTLVKQSEGTDYHAWFGNGHTYPFMGGTCIERGNYVFAGSESGRGAAGTRTNPEVSAVGRGTYGTSTGAHVYFRFYSGYADIKGIYAIKR